MNTQDARVLISLMIQDISPQRVSTKMMGNGEVVCVVDRQTYIWSRQDWEQWWKQHIQNEQTQVVGGNA
jgi:hypothetical protein